MVPSIRRVTFIVLGTAAYLGLAVLGWGGLAAELRSAFAQCFQSRMIQLASVIFSQATRESRASHAVKKNVLLLMDIL